MGDQKWTIRLVSGMWVLNLVAGMIPSLEYEPSEAVNGIFMAIVGSLYLAGKSQAAARDDSADDDKDKVTR